MESQGQAGTGDTNQNVNAAVTTQLPRSGQAYSSTSPVGRSWSSGYVYEQGLFSGGSSRKKKILLAVTVSLSALLIICLLCCMCLVFASVGANETGGFGSSRYIREIGMYSVRDGNLSETFRGGSTNKVVVIDISGAVYYSTESIDNAVMTSRGTTNNVLVDYQLTKALGDSGTKAIVLRLNTPGGVLDAAHPICKKIRDVSSVKPVYSFVDGEAASLGYLIANCSTKIYSRPNAITGSIGVRADILDLTGILTNIGAKRITITNSKGDQKAQGGIFNQDSPEYKQLQSILDEAYEYFIDVVWEGRSKQTGNTLTKSKLAEYADGRIFSGNQAFKAGLVDKVAELEDTLLDIVAMNEESFPGKSADVYMYQINVNPFSQFLTVSRGFFALINGWGNVLPTSKVIVLMTY